MENNKIRENTDRVGAGDHPTLAIVTILFFVFILAILLINNLKSKYTAENLPKIPASVNRPICIRNVYSINPKFTPEIFKQLGIVDYPEKGYWEAPIRQSTMKLRIPHDMRQTPTYENLSGGFINEICDYGKGYQIDNIQLGFTWYENQLWQNHELRKHKNIKTQEDYDKNRDIFRYYIWKVELMNLSSLPHSQDLNLKTDNVAKKENYYPQYDFKYYPLIFYPKFINKYGGGGYGIKNTVDDFTGFPILVGCDMEEESLENLTQEKINRLINRKWASDYVGNFRFCTDYLGLKVNNQRFVAEIYLQNHFVENIDKIYPSIRSKLKKLIIPNQ